MSMLISIDNGGTLTDACVIYGLKDVSERIYGEPRMDSLLEEVDYIRYSTTQGTNAVVQRKGPRLGLILRKGQKVKALVRNKDEGDLLEAMVGERVAFVDPSQSEEKLETSLTQVINDLMAAGANRLVVSLGGDTLVADEGKIKRVALVRYPRHLLGAVPMLYSHQLSDDGDDARRTWSSLINAFLHPAMERFLYNAENVLREARARNPLLIFCNDGTSSRVAKTVALKTWGSGPRGGMEGARTLAQHYNKTTVLTMDIGGTTTDIGMVDRGSVREQRWGSLEDIQISFPLCEIDSLGVGGSSIFKVVKGKLQVGPESVGGAPGPACFGYGGKEATITDVNLLLGILDGDSYFGGTIKLDPARAKAAIEENVAKPLKISLDEALVRMEAAYIEKISNAMASMGADVSSAALLAYGGAGPMTACKVAEKLGIKEIIVPRMAAVFSAFGIGFSDIAHNYDAALTQADEGGLRDVIARLSKRAERDMFAEGFDLSECSIDKTLTFTQNGEQAARRLNGDLSVPDGIKQAQDVRVQLRATRAIPHFALKQNDTKGGKSASTKQKRSVRLLEGKTLAPAKALPLYLHSELVPGNSGSGPAVVEEEYFTCVVPDGWSFSVNENYDLVLTQSN